LLLEQATSPIRISHEILPMELSGLSGGE